MVTTAKDVKKQTASTTRRKNKIKKIPLGLSHLVTGFVTVDDAGKVVIPPNARPLETLRNRIFCIKNSNGEFKTYISNKNGVVNNLKAKSIIADDLEFRGVVGKNNLEKEIFLAPPEAVKIAYMSHDPDANKEWSDVLIEFFKIKQPQGINLQIIPLHKDYFRKPNTDSKDDDEVQYSKWFNKFEKGERHTGILFSKIRSAFLIFNSPKNLIKSVSIAKYFTPVDISGNTKDWIEKTCVYFRGKNSRSESDWQLINKDNNNNLSDLNLLTPFCQIRVLVVLKEINDAGKKLVDGIFPINLQLYRTDGTNCEGPVYRNIARVLDDGMLLNNVHEIDYMGKNVEGLFFTHFTILVNKLYLELNP